MKQGSEASTGDETLIPKRGLLRTRTGCLTCRQRRKKCDEKKPKCSGCARNFLDCIWPSRVVQKGASITLSEITQTDLHDDSAKVVVLNRWPPPSKTKARNATRTSNGKHSDEHEEDQHVIRWIPRFTAFVDAERATWLSPYSGDLLQHYLKNTSTFLTAMPPAFNPFVNIVMPLSYSDDLLMHSVLALSGTHLSFERGDDAQIELATHRHYQLILKSLRASLTNPDFQDDPEQLVRLILILVVVCHVEALGGHPNGGIFPHLKACRILILNLVQNHPISTLGPLREAAGFAIETYTYLALINSITPFGRDEARTVPFDPFFASLDVLDGYGTFGQFFGCGRSLFEYIPPLAKLAALRLAEEDAGLTSSTTTHSYARIVDELESWASPPVDPRMAAWQTPHECAGEVYRQALLVFAKATACGSWVPPREREEIQTHVERAMGSTFVAAASPFVTVLLWPVMVVGSCLTRDDQRTMIQLGLVGTYGINTRQLVQARNLLQTLWDDDDPCAYGPFGLELVMKKYQINFSMG